MSEKGRLTDKQRRFCDEYLIDLNATQAAIRAGYSEKTAAAIGAENLTKPQIQNYLKKRLADREKRTEITQDMVIRELRDVAFAEAADYTDAKLKYSNKLKALELLGKHMGMFAERVIAAVVDPDVLKEVETLVLGNGDDQG